MFMAINPLTNSDYPLLHHLLILKLKLITIFNLLFKQVGLIQRPSTWRAPSTPLRSVTSLDCMSGKKAKAASQTQETRSSPRNLAPLQIDYKGLSPSSGTPSPNRLSISSPGFLNASQDSPSTANQSKKLKKSVCPCLRSSAGKDWVYPCSECDQNWHASCANLKGTNALTKAQEAIVKKIGKGWLCPWCFTVPFVKPANHPSTAKDETLLERTLSCTVIQNLLDEVKKSSENSSLPIDVSGIENRLDLLSKEIKEFKDSSRDLSASKARTSFASSNTPIHEEVVMDCPEKPYETISQNFLASEEMDYVTDLFGYLRDNGDFIMERGHGVKLYGEPYSYTGSKSLKPDAITPEFEKIIDQLSSELKLTEDERPNSILVNYYPASTRTDPADSFLAMHSDDESSIKAESKIITLSIGASRKVVFESKNQGKVKKVDLDATHNSVYVMSRQSQNWFCHGVPPPPDPNEVTEDRFSVTFRSLHKKFKRSMIILGDSNTADINFGVGTGKVGQSYPGKRVKAAMVKDINAKDCTGYSNIFIMCGTNDLRCKYISSEQDIIRVVEKLQEKLVEIKQLCSGAKVFVIPVMPSRIPKMNLNITMYNHKMREDSYCIRDFVRKENNLSILKFCLEEPVPRAMRMILY